MIKSQLLPEASLEGRRQLNKGKYGEDGFPIRPKVMKFNFVGNVQPVSGFEILQVPEADRTRKVLNCWTEFRLEGNDIILFEGEEFEVRTVEDWTQQRLPHYKARLVKLDAQAQ